MRSGFLLALMITLVFAGGYLYNLAQAVCPVPISYRIGVLDDRFGLSEDEAKVAVAEAAEVWESATGQNLFTYDDTASFAVNFIFDERQAFLNEEGNFRDRLEAAENINEALTETHATLLEDYNALKTAYANKVDSYEANLRAYNQTVHQYNQEGGAPPEKFAELEEEKETLDKERQSLNSMAAQLNDMVDKINDIGDRGNALITNYNENVGEFNERIGDKREFTQGDYQEGRINIYTYQDERELQTVLIHEFGHALSLDHVEGEESFMYFLIGGQPADMMLSEFDLTEFNRVCGSMNLWDKIVYRLTTN